MSSRKGAIANQAAEEANRLDSSDFSQQVEMGEPRVQQETPCGLTKEKFANSICKILPDGADFREDLFNIEG